MRIVRDQPRRGVTMVEFATIAPILFLMLFGMMMIGMDISRYQQCAALARDCARWASVHGGQWASEANSGTLTTKDDIFDAIVTPRSFLFDVSTLKSNSTITWDDAGQMPNLSSGTVNRVHVTLRYQATSRSLPVIGTFFSDLYLQSTCEREMSY